MDFSETFTEAVEGLKNLRGAIRSKKSFDGRGFASNLALICVLKWSFLRTFPGNLDATLKSMSELTFVRFCKFLSTLLTPSQKQCLQKAKTTKSL